MFSRAHLLIHFLMGCCALVAGIFLFINKPSCLPFYYALGFSQLLLILLRSLNVDQIFMESPEMTGALCQVLCIFIYFNLPPLHQSLNHPNLRRAYFWGFILAGGITVLPILII